MQVDRLADGLWRWTVPHPKWLGDAVDPSARWPVDVSCLYHESPEGIVLIDPLVPAGGDGERFWRHLDQDVERVGLPPTIVVSAESHGRSADAVHERYPGSRVLGVSLAASCTVDRVLVDGEALPGDCHVTIIDAAGATRMAIVQCSCHGLLWLSDLLIDDGAGGLRRPPAAWFDDPGAGQWLEQGLPRLLPNLLDAPIEHLVSAHGPVISVDARAALVRAFDLPVA